MPKGVKTSVRGREAGKGRVAEPLGVDGNVRMKADEVLRLLESTRKNVTDAMLR